jgi:outer membrane protein OmpA-like peptidoglycan-associated protein
MKEIGFIWISMLLITHCILGQQKDTLTPHIQYQKDTYLELMRSEPKWENLDLSILPDPSETTIDWQQLIQNQQTLIQKLLLQMDSLQQQQSWQFLVYHQQIQQIQTQIDELQETVITLKHKEDGPSMANLENHLMLDYNLPTEIPIYFEENESTIQLEALMALNEIIELLAIEPQSAVLLSGHANEHSHPTQNIELSQQRAVQVRNMLISAGIGPERIMLRYLGNQADDGKRNFKKVNITFIQKP